MLASEKRITYTEKAQVMNCFLQYIGSSLPEAVRAILGMRQDRLDAMDAENHVQIMSEIRMLNAFLMTLAPFVENIPQECADIKEALVREVSALAAGKADLLAAASASAISKDKKMQEAPELVQDLDKVSLEGTSLGEVIQYLTEVQECKKAEYEAARRVIMLSDQLFGIFRSNNLGREAFVSFEIAPEPVQMAAMQLREATESSALKTSRKYAPVFADAMGAIKAAEEASRGDIQAFAELTQFIALVYSIEIVAAQNIVRGFSSHVAIHKVLLRDLAQLLEVAPTEEKVENIKRLLAGEARDIAQLAQLMGIKQEATGNEILVLHMKDNIEEYRKLMVVLDNLLENPTLQKIASVAQLLRAHGAEKVYSTDNPEDHDAIDFLYWKLVITIFEAKKFDQGFPSL